MSPLIMEKLISVTVYRFWLIFQFLASLDSAMCPPFWCYKNGHQVHIFQVVNKSLIEKICLQIITNSLINSHEGNR